MKKLCCLLIDNFMFFCLTVAMAALFCLHPGQAFGSDADSGQRPILSRPQGNSKLITSGVYGPFSPYFSPSLSPGYETCYLLTNNFTVVCFPAKSSMGSLLAETEPRMDNAPPQLSGGLKASAGSGLDKPLAAKNKTVQAQLFAATNIFNDRPIPEMIVNFSLADMDQKFFAKDAVKQLLEAGSIFDEACSFTYQVDAQPQKSEGWYCSSFLKYFDKHTGRPGLFYELRIRPVALRAASAKSAPTDADQNFFNFFKNLQNGKALNFKVDLLDDDLTADAVLDLTAYDKWINRLLDVYYIDTPTVDTSALDELAALADSLDSADEKSELQNTAGTLQAGEKVYGPFDFMPCRVHRYIKQMDSPLLYPDMFLVDCSRLKIYEEKQPAWTIQILTPKIFEEIPISDYYEKHAINVVFKFQDMEFPSSVMMTDIGFGLMPITQLVYKLSAMPQDFFNSQAVQDTLHSAGQIKKPCVVSYIADGRELNREQLKGDLSYQVASGDINVKIDVDYGFKKCFQLENKSCQKDMLVKAVSFLKDIKNKPQELAIKIEFEEGEAVTAKFDLSNFNLETIDRLLTRAELID